MLRRSLYTLISLAPFTPPIVIVPTIHARYELFKKLLLLLASPASSSHPPRSLFLSFLPFFSEFSRKVFSYKTKWHLFGIGRKNTVLNPFLPFSISLTPSPFRSLNNRNPSSPLAPVHVKHQQVPSVFSPLSCFFFKRSVALARGRDCRSARVKFPVVTL